LLKALEKSQKEIEKPKLLSADDEDVDSAGLPVWLVMTAKKHIIDKARLYVHTTLAVRRSMLIHLQKARENVQPYYYLLEKYFIDFSSTLPHPLWTSNELRICLITADPPTENPKAYKDLVQNIAFPEALKSRIAKVVAVSKLKTKYKPYESRRKLLAEYDIFLADERVINLLPGLLGKVFYKSTTKRPIPVSLTGHEKWHGQGREGDAGKLKRKREKDTGGPSTIGRPEHVGEDIEKALKTTLVHLAPSVTTAVRVAWGTWSPEMIAENTAAVVEGMAAKFIPKGWRGIKSIHIKGPDTIALPIWLADELWVDEEQVLDQDAQAADDFNKKKKKRKALAVNEELPKAIEDGQPPIKKNKRTIVPEIKSEPKSEAGVKIKSEKSTDGGAVKKVKKEKSEKDAELAKEAAERKKMLKEEKAAARKEAEKEEAVEAKKPKKSAKNVTSKKGAVVA
jgi:ribosome biogenesis protein UTP30